MIGRRALFLTLAVLAAGLAQAYMYRGMLFIQQGAMAQARKDLTLLRRLDAKLAADLERALDGNASDQGTGGVSPQYE